MILEGYQAMIQKHASRNGLLGAIDYLVLLYTGMGRPDEVAKWQAERAKYLVEVAPAPRLVK